MKICTPTLALLGCLCLVASVAAAQDETTSKSPVNILFIGNSYTFFNSLNDVVGDMLSVSGVPTQTTRSTPGGWRLRQHFNGETPNGYKDAPTPEVIASKKWDYVVLQEQSSGAVDRHAEFMEYGQKLVGLIHENNPSTKVILYETWGRCDGMFEGYGDDATRRAEVLASWEKKYGAPDDSTVGQLRTGMQGAYEELQKQTDSLLAPVGKAFAAVGDKVELHCDEKGQKPHHPNPDGTYLAGCVFFKTITGQSPVGMWKKLADAGKKCQTSEETAAFLEKIADETVK